MKWYITTILMPDNYLYIGITEEKPEGRITEGYKTQEHANNMARFYSKMTGMPLFEDYREEGITECIMQY